MVYSISSVISDIEHEGHGPLVDLYYVKTNSHQQSQQFVQSCNDKAHKMNKVLKHTILWAKRPRMYTIFIGPKFDRWQPLSVTNWLTPWPLVDLIDVTLACEDANSKFVDAVTVADDDGVGNNLLQIWNLRFRQKAKLLFRLWAQGLVKIWSWSSGKIWCWSLVSFFLLMFCKGNVESKLNLGRDCEARFGQDFEL